MPMKQLLRPRDLEEEYGWGRSTINYWRKIGLFPEPIRLGQNSIAWRRATIEAWLDSQSQIEKEIT